MNRICATAILTVLLASGSAAAQNTPPAQPAEGERRQEAISDPRAATNAIIRETDREDRLSGDEPPISTQRDSEAGATGRGDRDTGVSAAQGERTDAYGQMPVPAEDRRDAGPQDQTTPVPPATATRGADPDAEGGRGYTRMHGEQIPPTLEGPTPAGRIAAEELTEYTVHLADQEDFGTVERLIINLETGQLERLVVSTRGGGILGLGGGRARYEIPFDQVAAINTGTRELRVAISSQQIKPGDGTTTAEGND